MLTQLTVGLTVIATAKNTTNSQTSTDSYNRSNTDAFTIGSGTAKSANKCYADERSLNTTSETLDLSGSLENKIGETQAFAKVRALHCRNTSATGTITLDTTLANGAVGLFDGTFTLGPGEEFVCDWSSQAGRAITAGTADLLKVTASDNCTYEIMIAGE